MSDWQRKIAKEMDGRMMAALGVSSTTTNPPEPVSVGKILSDLRELALKMPKQETWVSTKDFPGSGSVRIEASGENFVVAHPMFWARLSHECRDYNFAGRDLSRNQMMPFMGIPIIEIDHAETDNPERRQYIDGIWHRLIEAVKVASVNLPDWLLASPKFSEHG